ncbi:MAG: AAA family ATPase [Pseudomonadota bacterium]
MPGKVIILNGASSSGKTTLALALQQQLAEPYQHISLDQFRDGLPARTRGLNAPAGTPGASGLNVVPDLTEGEPLTHIRFGDHGAQVMRAMRRSVRTFSDLGLHVIVDDLMFEPDWLLDYANLLSVEHTWVIGIFCDPEEIERREAQRLGRFPGTARAHTQLVHSHGGNYDLQVDSSAGSAHDLATGIIARLQYPPQMLRVLADATS